MGADEQRKAGWWARWRERRREKAQRAAGIHHRAKEAGRRDYDRASKTAGEAAPSVDPGVKRILRVVSSAPLVPGPLYGLRTWRVVTHDGRERLSAPLRGTTWGPDDVWLEAACGEGHRAPAADCRCGIHAWHPRRASARRVLRSRFDLPGIVEVDGAVEVHEDGFRAQRGRPYAFVRLPGRNPFLIERLAAAYGAEVLDLRRPDELLAVCRERSLGLEEPVVEQLLGADAIAERRRARARQRRRDALRVVAALLVIALLCALALALS